MNKISYYVLCVPVNSSVKLLLYFLWTIGSQSWSHGTLGCLKDGPRVPQDLFIFIFYSAFFFNNILPHKKIRHLSTISTTFLYYKHVKTVETSHAFLNYYIKNPGKFGERAHLLGKHFNCYSATLTLKKTRTNRYGWNSSQPLEASTHHSVKVRVQYFAIASFANHSIYVQYWALIINCFFSPCFIKSRIAIFQILRCVYSFKVMVLFLLQTHTPIWEQETLFCKFSWAYRDKEYESTPS